MDKKEAENNVHLEKRKLRANRASETEEQRKERLRIRLERIEKEGEPKNYKRERKVHQNLLAL